MLPKDFYKKVEGKNYLKKILYGDTDSIFLIIKDQNSADMSPEEKWNKIEPIAENINKLIVQYVTEHLLPKANINPSNNKTFFKTELLMESAMFLDVKKNYAYKLIVQEGKVIDPPKISYTGIQVVKSDTAKITQNMLKEIIEHIMLNEKIDNTNKFSEVVKSITKFKNIYDESVNTLNFREIGFPVKWGKRDFSIKGMQLYNYIMGQDIFSPGSSGFFIYTLFTNQELGKVVDLKSTKGITVPYDYNPELIGEKMSQFGIKINHDEHWNKIFTTTCNRVVELAKHVRPK